MNIQYITSRQTQIVGKGGVGEPPSLRTSRTSGRSFNNTTAGGTTTKLIITI